MVLTKNMSCDVKCDLGYTGGYGSALCPYDSELNGAVLTNLTCVENRCAAYSFTPGVKGATCSDGVRLSTHTNPSCDLSCKPGYHESSGNTQSRLICPEDAADGQDIYVQFSCDMNQCQAVSLPLGVVGDVSNSNPCTEGMILRTHADQYCEASCDQGYFGLPGYISCPQNAMLNDSTVFSGMCIEVSCNDFVFPSGVESSNCESGIRLTTHTKQTCDLSCKSGYFGDVDVICPDDAVFGTEVTVSGACYEQFCFMNELDWMGVDETNPDCSRNTELSTATYPNCTLECLPGYRNTATINDGVVRCTGALGLLDSSNLNCTQNQCQPVVFNSSMSVVSDSTRDDKCENNMILSTHTNSRCVLNIDGVIHTAECPSTASHGDDIVIAAGAEPRCAYYDETCGRLGTGQECQIECGYGYVGIPGKIQCPQNAQDNDPVDILQVRECVERQCDEYTILPGYQDVNITSSTDVLRLSAVTDPVRNMYCKKGYTGSNLTVLCGSNGGSVSVIFADNDEIYCRENVCKAILMTAGVVTYGDNKGCVNGERLNTVSNSECTAACSSGYDMDTGHLVCEETADDDDSVVVQNLTCNMAVNSVTVLGSNRRRRELSSSSQNGLVCSMGTTSSSSYSVVADSISTDAQNQKIRFEPFDINQDGEQFFVEIEGQTQDLVPCVHNVRVDSSTHLDCDIPSGVGTNRVVRLLRRVSTDSLESTTDTFILEDCVVNYAPPVVTNVTGCDSDGCSRNGGNVVEIRGENFGPQGLVVFVNGEECKNVTHDNTEPHSLVRCEFPALSQYQPNVNVLLVVQSDQFGAYHNFRFEVCELGMFS